MSTSQNKMILSHLKSEPINDSIAREEYGCRRLASRINDLRNQGYEIETIIRNSINRFGKKCSYAEYKLERAS
tara:strand:+ start:391 stop:609 length:219 start_codon:yes stop_codon:yes gene_type:complete